MILFTNGCSWTWGGGLEPYFNSENERQQLVWPYYLSKKLGIEKVINLSKTGGSNQRIFRTTFDYFNKINDQEIIAIIQFTQPSRFEYYDTNDLNDFSNIDKRWIMNNAIGMWDVFHKPTAKLKLEYYLRTYTEIEGLYKLLAITTSLAYLFESIKIKYYFWYPLVPLHLYPQNYKDHFLKFPMLDKNYGNLSYKYDRVSENDCHPNLNGHKQIADCIFSELNF